jgi:hypothetical protein
MSRVTKGPNFTERVLQIRMRLSSSATITICLERVLQNMVACLCLLYVGLVEHVLKVMQLRVFIPGLLVEHVLQKHLLIFKLSYCAYGSFPLFSDSLDALPQACLTGAASACFLYFFLRFWSLTSPSYGTNVIGLFGLRCLLSIPSDNPALTSPSSNSTVYVVFVFPVPACIFLISP